MKKLLAIGAIAVLAFAGSVSASRAAVVTLNDHLKFSNGPGSPGGIFHVNDVTQGFSFDTFCVELTQGVNFSDTFVVDGLSTATISAGKSLTNYVSWLYTQFVNHTLSDFNFAHANDLSGSIASAAALQANELQYAIWKGIGYTDNQIQNAGGTTFSPSTQTLVDWANAYNADGTWSHAGTNFGDVQIINLGNVGDHGAANAQDQLVLIPHTPPGASPAPEPTSLAIWGFVVSLGGVVAWRRQVAA
jgi:hypothetical protein